MGCFGCFNGGSKNTQKAEEERLASVEARAKAAEAAQKRQEEFEKSAAGRAARAQLQQMAKQSANQNKGEPVLKCLYGIIVGNHKEYDPFVVNALAAVANGMRARQQDRLFTGPQHRCTEA